MWDIVSHYPPFFSYFTFKHDDINMYLNQIYYATLN